MKPGPAGAAPGLRHLAQNEYEEILRNAPDAKVIVDVGGRIVFMSQQVRAVLGYSEAELIGQPVHVLIPTRYQVHHAKHIREYFSQPATRPMGRGLDLWARTRDGRELPVEISLSSVGDGADRLVVANLRDVSTRREAMEAMRRLNDELQRKTQDLEALVGDLRVFAQTASHDLQAPLRQITQFLTLLERRCGASLPPEGREYVQFAVESAGRMSRLVQNVLAYSRIGSAGQTFEQVPLCELVSDLARTCVTLIEEAQARIHCEDMPAVWGDRGQLSQLFQNLVTNALVYRSDAPPEIRVSAVREGDRWAVSVRDNGIGIDPKHHGRIFEMFQRGGATTRPGSGVGLAICKRVVERHHGQIRVDSQPGAGACFTFTLPALPDVPARSAPAAA